MVGTACSRGQLPYPQRVQAAFTQSGTGQYCMLCVTRAAHIKLLVSCKPQRGNLPRTRPRALIRLAACVDRRLAKGSGHAGCQQTAANLLSVCLTIRVFDRRFDRAPWSPHGPRGCHHLWWQGQGNRQDCCPGGCWCHHQQVSRTAGHDNEKGHAGQGPRVTCTAGCVARAAGRVAFTAGVERGALGGRGVGLPLGRGGMRGVGGA